MENLEQTLLDLSETVGNLEHRIKVLERENDDLRGRVSDLEYKIKD